MAKSEEDAQEHLSPISTGQLERELQRRHDEKESADFIEILEDIRARIQGSDYPLRALLHELEIKIKKYKRLHFPDLIEKD